MSLSLVVTVTNSSIDADAEAAVLLEYVLPRTPAKRIQQPGTCFLVNLKIYLSNIDVTQIYLFRVVPGM